MRCLWIDFCRINQSARGDSERMSCVRDMQNFCTGFSLIFSYMRKLLFGFLMLVLVSNAHAQNRNEVKINIFNTIALGSVELGYEYFLDSTQLQSIGVEFLFNDRFSYYPQGDGKEFKTNSYMLFYNYYFMEGGDPSSFYITPFFKYRAGTYNYLNDNSQMMELDMNSAIIGIGVGYKWIFNGQLALGPYANIGRGFTKDVADHFTPVEVNAGFGIGYRF